MKEFFVLAGIFLSSLSPCFATYYSQCGQDQYVHENFFYGKKNGIFVDIGAHNGIYFSNTCFFEKEQNWTGICIEPMPEIFADLQKNRKCILIPGCISEQPGIAQFFRIHSDQKVFEMFSGLLNKYDPRHLQKIQNALNRHEGDYEIIDVNCYLLSDVLDANGIIHVNFLSIDTEGGEFDILQTIDFDRYEIDVITVENNFSDNAFLPFLESKGFYLATILEQDMLFINKNFIPSSKLNKTARP